MNVWEQDPEKFKLPWPEHATVYVDVDGTLVKWPGDFPGRLPRKPDEPGFGKPPLPNEKLIGWLREQHEKGTEIYIWSRGGSQHAKNMSEFVNIDDIVKGYLTKPHMVIDDDPNWIAATKIVT